MSLHSAANDQAPCPCGSGQRYAACCARLHAGPLHLQRLAGRAHRLHEASRFVIEAGRWFYLDGE